MVTRTVVMSKHQADPDAVPDGGAATHLADPADPFSSVLGDSLAIRAAIALARRVAGHPTTTVLLHGETGTGKELFSRGIHYGGPNASEPFVSVNCSAIPDTLLESELFGHERGAFTDARTSKKGLFELAGTGTLFLDEVSELPLALQPKLLRVLEERRVRRLGAESDTPVACRVIAASNADIALAVAAGRFREDLYYRLNVFRIELPSLRMRAEDVDALARAFVGIACRHHGIAPKTLTEAALDVLRVHAWPGNIRELRNTIERAVILADGSDIDASHITLQRRTVVAGTATAEAEPADTILIPSTGRTLRDVELELIRITRRLAGDNHSLMSRMLGVSRPTVIRRLRQMDDYAGHE